MSGSYGQEDQKKAGNGVRREAVVKLLRGNAPEVLTAAEVADLLGVPRQQMQVLLQAYRAQGFVKSSGTRGCMVWTVGDRVLPDGVKQLRRVRSTAVPPPAPKPKRVPAPVQPAPRPRPAFIPAPPPARQPRPVAKPAPPPLPTPAPSFAPPKVPKLGLKADQEVIVPPNVQITRYPTPLDTRYTVEGPVVGDSMRDWAKRRGVR